MRHLRVCEPQPFGATGWWPHLSFFRSPSARSLLGLLLTDQSQVFVCGPSPMVKAVCGPKVKRKQGPLLGVLKEAGYEAGQVYKF